MNEDGVAEGACERNGRAMGAAIPNLPLIERSSVRNTRRAVKALQVIHRNTAGDLGETRW